MKTKTVSKFALAWRAEHRPGSPAKIVADEEVRRFIDERIERMSFRELAEACLAKFGSERAPAKSTISRYFHGGVKGAPKRPTRPHRKRKRRQATSGAEKRG